VLCSHFIIQSSNLNEHILFVKVRLNQIRALCVFADGFKKSLKKSFYLRNQNYLQTPWLFYLTLKAFTESYLCHVITSNEGWALNDIDN
jgi:hypothetical protein